MTSLALPPEIAAVAIVLAGAGIAAPVDEAISRLEKLAKLPQKGLGKVMGRAIVLPITTFFASVAGLIVALFNIPISTADSLAFNLGLVVNALVGGQAGILQQGATVTQQNLAIFGVLGFLVAVAVVLGGWYLFAAYREEDETSNIFPGLADVPSWVPGIGAEEEGGD